MKSFRYQHTEYQNHMVTAVYYQIHYTNNTGNSRRFYGPRNSAMELDLILDVNFGIFYENYDKITKFFFWITYLPNW